METIFQINPTAVYTASNLIDGVDVTQQAIDKAHRSGRLRFAKVGHKKLMLGSAVIAWLDAEASPAAEGGDRQGASVRPAAIRPSIASGEGGRS